MIVNRVVILFVLTIAMCSCKNDDNGTPEPDPPRALSEVIAEDNAEIKAYLQTHFYNYEEFDNPPENFEFRIKLDTIAGDNSGKTPLIDQMQTKVIQLSSSNLGIEIEENNVEHTIYYLSARPGVGDSPAAVDSVFLRYEGSLLNGNVFDNKIDSPVWLDLQGTLTQSNPGTIRGFKNGLPNFKAGGNIITNDDGTFEVEDFDSGLLILPSALAYYNGTQVGIPYSPIMFNLEVLATNTADHDRDGVPTKDEVEIDEQGNITLTDSNDDGIPDYLDPDS